MDYLARLLYGVSRKHSRSRGAVVMLPLQSWAPSADMDPLRTLLFKEDVTRRTTPPHCDCGARIKRQGTKCKRCAALIRYHTDPAHLLRGNRRVSPVPPVVDPAAVLATEQGSVSNITLILRERRRAYHRAMQQRNAHAPLNVAKSS
jgi:hypothetical protein